MRFFFDSSVRTAQSEFLVRETPAYWELITSLNEPDLKGASFFYVIPQSEYSVLTAACWGHDPDAMYQLFLDKNFGDDWLKVFCETYPIQGQLILNGIHERFSDGALVSLLDPDDGETKWFVVTVVGNIEVGSEPDDQTSADEYGLVGNQRFLMHSRLQEAIQLVGLKSFEAAIEYQANEISTVNKAKMYAKGAWKGYVGALDDGAKWMSLLSSS
jgi:hypothetical protein